MLCLRATSKTVSRNFKELSDALSKEPSVISGINPNSYLMRFFLRSELISKLREIRDVNVNVKFGTVRVILLNEPIGISSKVFKAYKSYDIRIEKIFGNLYLVVDYRLTIRSPRLNEILSVVSDREISFENVLVKCINNLKEEGKQEVISGIILKRLNNHVEVQGIIRTLKDNKPVERYEGKKLITLDQCRLFNNPQEVT